MDKNSDLKINLSEICYGFKNIHISDLVFWIMANIYPSRRWQSFSSLLFGSLCCSRVWWGEAIPKFRLLFLPFMFFSPSTFLFFPFLWTQPLYLTWGYGGFELSLSYLSLLKSLGKEKKRNEWRSSAGHLLHLLPCMDLFFLIHFPIFCQVPYQLSQRVSIPRLLHTAHRT